MKLEKVIEVLNKKQKGTYVKVGWSTNIESAKARKMGIEVIKETDATVRWGVNYSNLKRVKELKAAKSEEAQTTVVRKPWYRHLEATPHIIEHLNDSTKQYLQLFTINKKGYMKTKYYINGELKTKQEVIDSGYVNASEFAQKEECLIMNILISNIRFIGQEV
jgi:hypothetical protein